MYTDNLKCSIIQGKEMYTDNSVRITLRVMNTSAIELEETNSVGNYHQEYRGMQIYKEDVRKFTITPLKFIFPLLFFMYTDDKYDSTFQLYPDSVSRPFNLNFKICQQSCLDF